MAGDLDKKCKEYTPRECFRCESEDHLISEFPKPLKENNKRKNQVRFIEKVNCASQKEYNNSKITATKIYINLWNVCLIMTNLLVGISVTVRN